MSNSVNMLLLLVEDDDNDVIITKRKIAKSAIKIDQLMVAGTLEESRVLVSHNKFDIVLLDLNLPDSSGINTLIEFKKFYNGITIVLTSIDDEMVGVEAIKSGADDYLVKSNLNESMLSASIFHSIERRKRWLMAYSINNQIDTIDNLLNNGE